MERYHLYISYNESETFHRLPSYKGKEGERPAVWASRTTATYWGNRLTAPHQPFMVRKCQDKRCSLCKEAMRC